MSALPRIGETATVAGVVRTLETLHPDGHYRITLDVDLSKLRPTPLDEDAA